MLRMAGAYIRLDVRIVEVDTSFFDPGERIVEIRQSSSDRFDFGAGENEAGFHLFQDLIAMISSSIGDDIRAHSRTVVGRLPGAAFFAQVLEGETSLNNFLERNVGIGHARTDFNHWLLAIGQLTNPFGDEVYQNRCIRNDLRRFFEEMTGHR